MSNAKPAVTVVITTFNGAAWIRRTVQDVLDQEFRDLELIIVDDGSTDSTPVVLQELLAERKDPRVSVIRQPNSGTAAHPRNRGLEKARAEWITFLDHDDRWSLDRLARVMEAAPSAPEMTAISHDESIVREGRKLGTLRYGPQTDSMYLDLLVDGNRLSTSATTLKTRAVREAGGFDERKDFFTVEDYDLWLRLAERGHRTLFLPEVLGEYTLHPESISANTAKNYQRYRSVVTAHLERNAALLAQYRRRILGRLEYQFARAFQKEGDLAQAHQHYRAAFALGFHSPKLAAGWLLAKLGVAR